jgi:hypothetical protein
MVRSPASGRIAWLALLLPFACFLPSQARGGAWTQPPGVAYVRAAYAWQSSRVRFDETGEKIGLEPPGSVRHDTEYRAREVRIYAEYGLLSRVTPYGSVAYKRVRIEEPVAVVRPRLVPGVTHATDGFGDVYLGSRCRLSGGSIPMSAAVEVKLPSGYSTSANPALGNGEVDVTLRGLVGASIRWLYTTADLGWSQRGGDYQNELVYSAEIGGRFAESFYSWRGVLRGRRALGAVAPSAATTFDPSLASPRLLELSAAVGARVLPQLDVEVGAAQVLTGRNTLAGAVFELALAWSPSLHR